MDPLPQVRLCESLRHRIAVATDLVVLTSSANIHETLLDLSEVILCQFLQKSLSWFHLGLDSLEIFERSRNFGVLIQFLTTCRGLGR